MKLEYLSTLDETIETQILWLRGVNTIVKWRLWGVFYWIVIASLFYTFSSGPALNKILGGLAIGGLVGGNLVFNAENSLKRKIRKLILKKTGVFDPAPAIVTLLGNKLEFSSRDSTITFDLKKIKSVEHKKGGLVLDFQEGKLLYLPQNAFNEINEKEKWLSAIKAV